MCCSCFQGGVSDDVSLTAYITAALLELGLNTTVSVNPVNPHLQITTLHNFIMMQNPCSSGHCANHRDTAHCFI